MNKKIFFALIIISLFFCACSSKRSDNEWEDGYKAGYSDGTFDSDSKHENDFAKGYHEGLSDADISSLFEEAEAYALFKSDCSVYEAMQIIGIYNAQMDGEKPSESEYEQAVNSLFFFYEYLDQNK